MKFNSSFNFCVYLTVYRGNKLPPFYIGSSTVSRILKQEYHGSVSSKRYKRVWNNEIRTHPELFVTYIICTFETKEEALSKELKIQERLKVHTNSMYINMSLARKRGFAVKPTQDDRDRAGLKLRGRVMTDIHRSRLSESAKKRRHSECTKAKMSRSHSGQNHHYFNKKRSKEHILKSTLNNPRKLKVLVTDRDGIEHYTDHLLEWCKLEGFDYPDSARRNLLYSGRYKGYTLQRIK